MLALGLIISSLVLNLVDEGSHIREQLNGKFISSFKEIFGVLCCTHAWWSTSQDNSTSGQRGALGEEADELRDAEDQVSVHHR